jgi:hypothetical protein
MENYSSWRLSLFLYFQMELLIQAHLTRESFALSPALVKDYRHMLELAPRLLEELVKVLGWISFSLNLFPFSCGLVHVFCLMQFRLSILWVRLLKFILPPFTIIRPFSFFLKKCIYVDASQCATHQVRIEISKTSDNSERREYQTQAHIDCVVSLSCCNWYLIMLAPDQFTWVSIATFNLLYELIFMLAIWSSESFSATAIWSS